MYYVIYLLPIASSKSLRALHTRCIQNNLNVSPFSANRLSLSVRFITDGIYCLPYGKRTGNIKVSVLHF